MKEMQLPSEMGDTIALPTERCSSLCAPGEPCALTEHGLCPFTDVIESLFDQITELRAELTRTKRQCADWLDEAASDIIDWGQNASPFTRFMFGFDDLIRLHRFRAADLRNAARGNVEMTEKGNDDAAGDDDAAPECTCAAKDMTFGRCCKVTPNAALTGAEGRSPKASG